MKKTRKLTAPGIPRPSSIQVLISLFLIYQCLFLHLMLFLETIGFITKSNLFLLSHHHSTCALVSEIFESVLQTVQKQFTYRQYILTDLYRRQCAEYTYIYSVHSVLFKTYLQLSRHVMHRMYTFYIMYTYIHTIVCRKKGATDYT